MTPADQAAFHQVLLRIAGWVPDELSHTARRSLAAGHGVEVARAVYQAARARRVQLRAADAALVARTLAEAGVRVAPMPGATVDPHDEAPPVVLAPVDQETLVEYGAWTPYCLDLTVRDPDHAGPDAVDEAAIGAVSALAMAIALWRSWRYSGAAPKRVYLVQASGGGEELPGLADTIARALIRVGEVAPQIEVFAEAETLPAYQYLALGLSALLWARRPGPAVRVAGVFDDFDEAGEPGFAPSHPRLDGAETEAVLAYLDAGVALLWTDVVTADVVASTPTAVPMSFRTDGQFVWADAVAHYLRHHRLAPDADLLRHIRTRRYAPPVVDPVSLHRAMCALHALRAEDDPVIADLGLDELYDDELWAGC